MLHKEIEAQVKANDPKTISAPPKEKNYLRQKAQFRAQIPTR